MDWLAKDMYRCPNVRTELTDVYINAGPARPLSQNAYKLPLFKGVVREELEKAAS